MPRRPSLPDPAAAAKKSAATAAPKKVAKAPPTLPKQYAAALLDSSLDDLRAYLADLAGRQRPIRADFLLWRAAQAAGTTNAPTRAAVLETIRLGLKQPPKLPRRNDWTAPLSPADKRLLRLDEIAKVLLKTTRRQLTDCSDLPAARATALALLEAEFTELAPDAGWEDNIAERPHLLVVPLLRELWPLFPTSEARESLWRELEAVGRAGQPDSPGQVALIGLLTDLAPAHPDGPAAALRATLALLDGLLRRQPSRPPAPKLPDPRDYSYYSSPQGRADSAASSTRLRLGAHHKKLLVVRLRVRSELAAAQPGTPLPDLLSDLRPLLASDLALCLKTAEMLERLGHVAAARTLLEESLAALPADRQNWAHQFRSHLAGLAGKPGR